MKYAFVADAQALELPSDVAWAHEKFDAVFSNAVVHWCKRSPLGVLRGVKNVLKPGGRLVLEMGGFANCIGLFFESRLSSLKFLIRNKCRSKIRITRSYKFKGSQST